MENCWMKMVMTNWMMVRMMMKMATRSWMKVMRS
jgi:hypothetical protein